MAEHSSKSKEATPEPLKPSAPRPNWSTTPLTTIAPKASPSFQKTIDSKAPSHSSTPTSNSFSNGADSHIKEGEPCKNGGCKKVRTVENSCNRVAEFYFSPGQFCQYGFFNTMYTFRHFSLPE